jgi:hypothetical protein
MNHGTGPRIKRAAVAAEARGIEVRFVAARAGTLAPLPKST